MKIRCPWAEGNALYEKYHDEEWGTPVHEDRKQFEFLVLESAQAGLSWLTILKKRENFREAFDQFDPVRVAAYGAQKINGLLMNTGIIRNRKKIEAAVNNAARFLDIQNEFGSFDSYLWGFVDHQPRINHWRSVDQMPAKTELSDKISKDLKKRGFKFIGSTIIYSHLQAVGIVNDHITSCFRHRELIKACNHE